MKGHYNIKVVPSTNFAITMEEIQTRLSDINSKPAEEVKAVDFEYLAFAVLELQAALEIKEDV